MIDRPDAERLLQAMAESLENDVLPESSGAARHALRVVANLCRILAREALLGEDAERATRDALAQWLSREAPLPDLVRDLDEHLRAGDADFDREAREILLADARRRLAIDKPGYDA